MQRYQWSDQDIPDIAIEKPSRSAKKREALALQKLGEELTLCDKSFLNALPITESLREALAFVQTISSFQAKKRQMQYIGRLMRDLDAQTIEHLKVAMANKKTLDIRK